jgi:hypothetical protein
VSVLCWNQGFSRGSKMVSNGSFLSDGDSIDIAAGLDAPCARGTSSARGVCPVTSKTKGARRSSTSKTRFQSQAAEQYLRDTSLGLATPPRDDSSDVSVSGSDSDSVAAGGSAATGRSPESPGTSNRGESKEPEARGGRISASGVMFTQSTVSMHLADSRKRSVLASSKVRDGHLNVCLLAYDDDDCDS